MIAIADIRRGVLDAIDRSINTEDSSSRARAHAVELLHDRFDHYSWVGLYLIDGDELVLDSWKGPQPTEHVRIAVGAGICGAAAASGRTEVVDDVSADDRYVACFPSTRSEIVVPIHYAGNVVGEIDVDSDNPSAFDADDRAFLEQVGRMLSWRCHA